MPRKRDVIYVEQKGPEDQNQHYHSYSELGQGDIQCKDACDIAGYWLDVPDRYQRLNLRLYQAKLKIQKGCRLTSGEGRLLEAAVDHFNKQVRESYSRKRKGRKATVMHTRRRK